MWEWLLKQVLTGETMRERVVWGAEREKESKAARPGSTGGDVPTLRGTQV